MVLEQSRSGPLTAKIQNKYIHSSYNPEKEALNFYKKWKEEQPEQKRTFIILIEPGLGYLIPLIRKEYNPGNIGVIFLHSESWNYCKKKQLLTGIPHILYNKQRIQQDLDRLLKDQPMESLGIMEWKASARIFEDRKKSLDRDLLSFFNLMQANHLTERRFARLWFGNCIKNFLRYNYNTLVQASFTPAILAASGPSLERHIPAIKKNMTAYTIVALPSSLCILQAHDIQPDLLLTTDPGYYAAEHLRYLPPETLTAAPLSARLIPYPNSLAGFRQNMFAESLILKEKELPALPERGTVAATALDFLQNMGIPQIYICGLDFCMEDIKSHAKPHSFDPLIIKGENRFVPGYSACFDRAFAMTESIAKPCRFTKSMNSYQSWFSKQSKQNHIFRLPPSYRPLPWKEVPRIPRLNVQKKPLISIKNPYYPSQKTRQDRIITLIKTLEKDYATFNKTGQKSALLKAVKAILNPECWEEQLYQEIAKMKEISQ